MEEQDGGGEEGKEEEEERRMESKLECQIINCQNPQKEFNRTHFWFDNNVFATLPQQLLLGWVQLKYRKRKENQMKTKPNDIQG